MRKWKRALLVVVVILVVLAVAADRFVVPEVMVGMIITAPNANAEAEEGPRDITWVSPPGAGHLNQYHLPVGPPDATLDVEFVLPRRDPPFPGTILILHGLGDSKQSQMQNAGHWLGLGYCVVLVDHRGQGLSSGKYLTYGVRESLDMVQLLDDLAGKGRLAEPVGVLGFSYGGAVALQLAARDERVKAVVSVSAFSSLRAVVPPYAEVFAPWGAWWLRESHYDRALALAGERAGFDPADADCVRAAGATTARILVVHGRGDRLVPPWNARRIHAAAGERGELVLLEGDHITVTADESGDAKEHATRWFARWLTTR